MMNTTMQSVHCKQNECTLPPNVANISHIEIIILSTMFTLYYKVHEN